MVTRDTTYLITDRFFDAVVKKEIPLLYLVRYLFNVANGNRYLTRGSNENIAMTCRVSVARYVLHLVTRQVLDLVLIH